MLILGDIGGSGKAGVFVGQVEVLVSVSGLEVFLPFGPFFVGGGFLLPFLALCHEAPRLFHEVITHVLLLLKRDIFATSSGESNVVIDLL